MVSDFVMRLNLTDADKPRYDVPSEFVNKPSVKEEKRLSLSKIGFKFNKEPFSFSLSDF